MIPPPKLSKYLIAWHKENERYLPWKVDRDPYKIWISEIILQQTRVAQGTPYYLRFIERFPDVATLANAKEDDVLKLWQGLGYYSRARNLLSTARIIISDYDGVFPSDYNDILKLKGIGPYTAAAISSFAYGHSTPVIDGNVLRLISRLYAIHEPVDVTSTHQKIKTILDNAIKGVDPALFNQSIMDFGATVCTPKNPNCTMCIFAENCMAKAKDVVNLLPIKSKSIKKTTRYLNYFLILSPNSKQFLIDKRSGDDIWKGLYQLPLYETQSEEDLSSIHPNEYLTDWLSIAPNVHYKTHRLNTVKHILTHQTLIVNFYVLVLTPFSFDFENENMNFVFSHNYDMYPFPKVIAEFLVNYFEF